MKQSVQALGVLALVNLAVAADPCESLRGGVPACATSCINSAAAGNGCPNTADLACPCIPASSMAIQNAAFNCVLGACPGESLGAVLAGASAICACEATATQQPTSSTEAPPDTTTTTEAPPDTTTTTSGPPPDTSSTESPPGTTTTSEAPPDTTTTSGGPTDTSTCTTEAPPDTTTTEGPSTTCAPGTKQDCGPVASSAVPHCAKPCFDDAAPKVGCDATDYTCQCQPDKQSSLSAIVPACVATACPPASIPAVLAGASSVCACANAAPTPGPGCTEPTDTTSEEPPCTTETTEEPPCTTETETPTETCQPGTKKDCGPVATSAVPHCAKPCFDEAAPKVGCGATDYACQCQPDKQSSLSAIVPACVATACPAASIPAVLAGASSVCACANAPGDGGDCGPTQTGGNPPGGNPTGTGGNPPGGNPTGGNPTGGNPTGGNPPGGEPTGGSNPPGGEPTQPPTVTAAGSRHEVGIVAGVFAAVWLVAVAL